jgi:hypothetical protein
VRLHSRRDPVAEAERWLDQACSAPPPVLIVIGLGLGYVLDALERREAATTVIAIEPEPALLAPFMARRNWDGWTRSGRLKILTGPEYLGARETWLAVDPTRPSIPVLVHPVLERERHEAVRAARDLVSRLLAESRANTIAEAILGDRYEENTRANAAAIGREGDVAELTDALVGLPALVVGAGPSLDRCLSDLRLASQSLLVIAVDTALRPLLGAGVAPHVVVAANPRASSACHLCHLPATNDSWLVAEGSVDPRGLAEFGGRTFVFHVGEHAPWPTFVAGGLDRGHLRAWGSVVTCATDLALTMGCTPILFAGLDLAFTGGQPYARETAYEEGWQRTAPSGDGDLRAAWEADLAGEHLVREPDIAGLDTATTPHFVAFRNWIADQAVAFPDRRFINCTGAGILHGPRIEQHSLGDALRNLPITMRGGVHEAIAPLHPATVACDVPNAADAPSSGPSSTSRETTCVRNVTLAAVPGAALGPLGGVARHGDHYFLADTLNDRVVVVNETGRCQAVIGRWGRRAGEFWRPMGVAVIDRFGSHELFVCDSWNGRVQRFDATARFIGSVGDGYEGRLLEQPIAVCTGEGDLVWMLDRRRHRLAAWSALQGVIRFYGGRLMRTGPENSRAEGYYFPQAIARAADGNLVVADTANRRLCVVRSDGELLRAVPFDATDATLPLAEWMVLPDACTAIVGSRRGVDLIAVPLDDETPVRRIRLGHMAARPVITAMQEADGTVLVVDGPDCRMSWHQMPNG